MEELQLLVAPLVPFAKATAAKEVADFVRKYGIRHVSMRWMARFLRFLFRRRLLKMERQIQQHVMYPAMSVEQVAF